MFCLIRISKQQVIKNGSNLFFFILLDVTKSDESNTTADISCECVC